MIEYLIALAPLLTIVLVTVLMAGTIYMLYRRYPIHAIYKSKLGLEAMLDAIGEPLVVISRDYVVRRANKAYASLIGCEFKEIINKKCFALLRKRSSPCTDCKLLQALTERSVKFVARSPHPQNPNGVMTFTFSPCRVSFDMHIQDTIIEHIRDVTDLEQLKHDLEEKNRSLSKTMRSLKTAQQSIKDEIKLAQHIQKGILPKEVPQIDGIKFALTYHPVADVGGDVYDFIQFSPTKLGVFIGDASGHGLSSAFISTISKMSLYNHSKELLTTSELISQINFDLISNVQTSHYLTCFWGIFDFENRTLSYSRAGHPIPVVRRKDGTLHSLNAKGTFAGIIENTPYEQQEFRFQSGDRFFFFTDGIYEVVNRDKKKNDVMGYDQFVSILSECSKTSFNRVISSVQHRLSSFTYEDDYTLIVAEITM